MTFEVPLNELRFGHEANPPINARRVGRDDEVEDIAASIKTHGLITALKVKMIDERFYVGIGNRRLTAMRLLVERGDMPADEPTKCEEFEPDANPREVALAEQILRAPLHDADQYEEFRALADDGLSEDAIASRFGIEPKRVRRILALGRLAPAILDWWRTSEPTRETIGVVHALTLAPSIEDQERVFAKLQKQHTLYPHYIHNELGVDRNGNAGRCVTFIGKEAYEAAGGTVTEDLFGDNHVISDPALAVALAGAKLQAKCDELTGKEGWSWAALASDLPQEWKWNWRRLEVSKKKATADEKKTSGAVVELDQHGMMVICYGVVKPATSKPEKAGAAGAKGKAEKAAPAISNALHQRLSQQATLAAREALQQEPRLGLVALLAGFVINKVGTSAPIKVSHDGFQRARSGTVGETFAQALDRLTAMSDAELFKVAAGIAGEALHMERNHSGAAVFDPEAGALAAAIDSTNLYAALKQKFDAKDYFTGASKPLVITAIREAINEDEARKADKLKKAELVAFAVENVVGTGWLPPELRAATYSGPKAAEKKPAKAKAASKAKAAPKAKAKGKPAKKADRP